MSKNEIIGFVNKVYELDQDVIENIGTSVDELRYLLEIGNYKLLEEIIGYYRTEEIESLLSDDNPHSKKDYSCFNTVMNDYHPDDSDEWY